jgi:riboflavin kinase / FMN adenylyltransferase
MLIYNHLDTPPPFVTPLAITIGNFDGVHLAHQMLINKMKELAPNCAVLTFENHPQQILRGEAKPLITHPKQRINLLRAYGVDLVYQLPFTESFSQLSASVFLTKLKNTTNFTTLVLGHDAALGKNREGTAEKLFELSNVLEFSLYYLDPLTHQQRPISSSLIRSVIQQGELTLAQDLIGRPYSIFGVVEKGAQKGRLLGFRTANIPLQGLITPPFGVYVLKSTINGKDVYGVGNIGVAPTLNAHRAPLLEAHFFDLDHDLYKKEIEVSLVRYLREEKTFSNPQELKQQINRDAKEALNFAAIDLQS